MNQKFANRLKDYLDSECSDYDMKFSFEWSEDMDCCEVEVFCDDYKKYSKSLSFKYDENKDDLKIELSEGSF